MGSGASKTKGSNERQNRPNKKGPKNGNQTVSKNPNESKIQKKRITVYYKASPGISSIIRSEIRALDLKLNEPAKRTSYIFDWVPREGTALVPRDQKVLVFLSADDINSNDTGGIFKSIDHVKRSLKCLVIIDPKQSVETSSERLIQQRGVDQIVVYSGNPKAEDNGSREQLESFIRQNNKRRRV